MSSESCSEVSSISTLNGGQVVKGAPERAESEICSREEKSHLTPVDSVQYRVVISTKITIRLKRRKADIKDVTQTWRKYVNSRTRIEDSMAQKTFTVEVLRTRKTQKKIGHNNPSGDFKTFKRDDNRHLTSYGGSVETFEKGKKTGSTAERYFSHKTIQR